MRFHINRGVMTGRRAGSDRSTLSTKFSLKTPLSRNRRHNMLSVNELYEGVALPVWCFSAQVKESLFVQFVRIQRVMPPVPGETFSEKG
jgi:hypothetical protein